MHENQRGGQAFISTGRSSEIFHAGIEKISQAFRKIRQEQEMKEKFLGSLCCMRDGEHPTLATPFDADIQADNVGHSR